MTTLSVDANTLTKDKAEDDDMNLKEPKASPNNEIRSKTDMEKILDMEEKARRLEDSVTERAALKKSMETQNSTSPKNENKRSDETRMADRLEGSTECCAACCRECDCVIS